LRHECRWKAHGQILGQLQSGQLEFVRRRLAREAAGQDRQQVALLDQLLEQRRQGGGDLCELRFLRSDVEAAGIALLELISKDLTVLVLRPIRFAGGIDLQLQGALPESPRPPHWPSACVGRDHLIPHFFFLRLQ